MPNFDSLPGFRDFYPEETQTRNFIFEVWRKVCRRHNFAEYDAPILQPTELFTGKSGAEIVSQLFNFTDKGGREVTLRPEMTPYVCQMVAARAPSLKRPIRWFCIAECFRYERPQKGRLRSFYQFNADIFDEAGLNAEVELIALTVDLFRGFGLSSDDIVVRLSDRTLWLEFLAAVGLTPEQSLSVLQVVDKWERESPEEIKKKLATVAGDKADSLYTSISELMKIQSMEAMEQFFAAHKIDGKVAERLVSWRALLADLTAMGLADFVRVDLGVVRGLAYYTGFVYEVYEKKGESRALAGGGRYDNLIEKIGGPKMPAFGFGLGDVTLTNLLTDLNLLPKFVANPDLYMVYTEPTRSTALSLVSQLREAGYAVEVSLKPQGFGKQLKAADKAGVRYAVILGDEEIAKKIAKIKCLNSGDETEVPLDKLVEHLKGC